ncbi:MAG: hypothetical protein KJ587_08370 [Alphaproteobacteria bacterium]|nr:hypothetical protein [Alphaproteobacteria bacterium]
MAATPDGGWLRLVFGSTLRKLVLKNVTFNTAQDGVGAAKAVGRKAKNVGA